MQTASKVFFVSDLHLGAPSPEQSLIREKHFVKWLDQIKSEATHLFLVGDLFDFWFEYKHVVPKGYVRLLGKLAELTDLGVEIHIFAGNHDLWYKDYLSTQIEATIHHKPQNIILNGKHFYIAHGDGLGQGDHGYKFLKKVLTNPVSKFLFGLLHPDWGIGLANFFSHLSRHHNQEDYVQMKAPENPIHEVLYRYAKKMWLENQEIDYFIFGHRHIFFDHMIENKARCFILGDWITYFSYLEVSSEQAELKTFPISQKLPAEV